MPLDNARLAPMQPDVSVEDLKAALERAGRSRAYKRKTYVANRMDAAGMHKNGKGARAGLPSNSVTSQAVLSYMLPGHDPAACPIVICRGRSLVAGVPS